MTGRYIWGNETFVGWFYDLLPLSKHNYHETLNCILSTVSLMIMCSFTIFSTTQPILSTEAVTIDRQIHKVWLGRWQESSKFRQNTFLNQLLNLLLFRFFFSQSRLMLGKFIQFLTGHGWLDKQAHICKHKMK